MGLSTAWHAKQFFSLANSRLAIAGAVAVVAVLLVTNPPGGQPDQVYEPAHVQDGKVVPGQYRQREGK